MTDSLFRTEALEAHKAHLLGSIVLNRPLKFSFVALFAACLVLGFGLIVTSCSYARRTTVGGELLPDKPTQSVYATAPGIVTQQLIQAEQHAAAGQPLVELAPLSPSGTSSSAGHTVVPAPATGTILSLAQPGELVAAGKALAAIQPDGSMLEARLRVPSTDVGYLKIGDPLFLKFSAFPSQQFGLMRGVVRAISRYPVASASHPVTPEGRGDVFYSVIVVLGGQNVTGAHGPLPLQAGMSVSAEIKHESRPLYEWLLGPLYSLRRFSA